MGIWAVVSILFAGIFFLSGFSEVQASEPSWILVSTEINPEGEPTEVTGPPVEGRKEGSAYSWIVNDGTQGYNVKEVDNGYEYFDAQFLAVYTPPPSSMIPGETVQLSATVSGSGTVNEGAGGCNAGLSFEYRAEGISFDGETNAGLCLEFEGKTINPSFVVPDVHNGELKIFAFLWNCAPCDVIYTYQSQSDEPEPEEVPDETEPEDEEQEKPYPVIFLPGVAGSYLYVNSASSGNMLWPAPVQSAENFFLNEEGVSIQNNIVAGDAMRSAVVPSLNVYGSFIDSIELIDYEENGETKNYKEGETVFVWGYDWRLDNSKQIPALDNFVNKVRIQTDSKKVILIGHSMGGLISRAYAVEHSDKVDTLITIGSPFAGSPKPFYAMVEGYTFDNPMIDPSVMKRLLQNSPAAYQLLPQYDFVESSETFETIPNNQLYKIRYKGLDDQLVTSNVYLETLDDFNQMLNTAPQNSERLQLDYFQTLDSNNWSLNSNLVTKSDNFYDNVGTAFSPKSAGSVKHYVIIGTGIQTLQGYFLRPAIVEDQSFLQYEGKKVVLDPVFGDGDGTVPLKSADLKGSTQTYYINHEKHPPAAHGALTPSLHAVFCLQDLVFFQ